jgi:hypothetical protein
MQKSNTKVFLSRQKYCAQMCLKVAEEILKKIPKIQRQIRKSLQVFEGNSQRSQALICNYFLPIFRKFNQKKMLNCLKYEVREEWIKNA